MSPFWLLHVTRHEKMNGGDYILNVSESTEAVDICTCMHAQRFSYVAVSVRQSQSV